MRELWPLLLVVLVSGCSGTRAREGEPVAPPGPTRAVAPGLAYAAPAAPAPVRHPGPCLSTSVSNGVTASTRFAYDEAGRLIERAMEQSSRYGGHSERRSYGYDEAGRLVEQRIETTGPNAYVQVERSHYDDHGRLSHTDIDDGSGPPRWRTAYAYDDAGRMLGTRQIDLARGRTTFARRFVYEGERLVRDEVDNEGRGTFPKMVSHEYGDSGRVVRKVHQWDDRPSPNEIELFEYDELGRLVRRTDQRPSEGRTDPGVSTTLTLDAAGNVLATAQRHEGSGEVSARTEYDFGCWEGREVPPNAPQLRLHATFALLNVDMRLTY